MWIVLHFFVASQGATNTLERLGDIICVGLRGFGIQCKFN